MVTGVMRDLPHNTQLTGDMFLPNTSIADRTSQDAKQDWFCNNGWGYVSLAPGADPDAVIASMAPMLDRSVDPGTKKIRYHRHVAARFYDVHLTPFTQVHLIHRAGQFNMTPPGSWTTVYGVIAIGVLILLVACFNFMNLATARAMLRAREIALRKTMGAKRRQLIVQFLGEAVLMALLALVLAFAIAEMLLPIFDKFLQRPIGFHYASDWPLLLALGRHCRRRGPDQRQLSGAGSVRLPARRHLAHQQRRSGRLRRLAQRPGGAAVRGLHRTWHRRRRGLQPDQLCPQHRSGLSTRSIPHHGLRPHD